MPRVCFQLQVKPDRIAEYRDRHAEVWPDMLRALHDTGWRNYSLFLRADGLLIGYYETDDDAASQRALEQDPRTAAWEADMAGFFISLDGSRPDQGAPRLAEVFHLEDQLAALADGHDTDHAASAAVTTDHTASATAQTAESSNS